MRKDIFCISILLCWQFAFSVLWNGKWISTFDFIFFRLLPRRRETSNYYQRISNSGECYFFAPVTSGAKSPEERSLNQRDQSMIADFRPETKPRGGISCASRIGKVCFIILDAIVGICSIQAFEISSVTAFIGVLLAFQSFKAWLSDTISPLSFLYLNFKRAGSVHA